MVQAYISQDTFSYKAILSVADSQEVQGAFHAKSLNVEGISSKTVRYTALFVRM